jgi:hypothetical protein
MAVLGDNTLGATLSGTFSGDVKTVSRFQVTDPVQFSTGYIYLVNNGAAAQAIRMVVYADNAGLPGSLIGQSVEMVVQPTDVATPPTITGTLLPGDALTVWPDGWVTFVFPSVLPIPVGYVWIGLHRGLLGSNVKSRFDTGTSAQGNDVYSDGPSDPFGPATSGTIQWSAWLDVSPTPIVRGFDHIYSFAAGRAT